MDELPRIDLPQPFLREGRTGGIAQQTAPALPVIPFDVHAGIDEKLPTSPRPSPF